jgi:hypothetical protein
VDGESDGEALAEALGDAAGKGGQQRGAAPKRAAGSRNQEGMRLNQRVALLQIMK